MAGHSKWANIKFRKGVQDAKRGKIFTKLIREITVSARMGGPEEDTNPRLRDAVVKALKANMKRDTIDNAIKRGAGAADGEHLIEMQYEGYAPHGVAVLVLCLSDNKNRTVSEVRHAFTKHGGNLGTDGSVSYLFQKQGIILMAPNQPEEAMMELAIESNADDVSVEDGHVMIVTKPEDYHHILDAMTKAGYTVEESQVVMHPQTQVELDAEGSESVIKLVDTLEELDDVQYVYTNAAFSEVHDD